MPSPKTVLQDILSGASAAMAGGAAARGLYDTVRLREAVKFFESKHGPGAAATVAKDVMGRPLSTADIKFLLETGEAGASARPEFKNREMRSALAANIGRAAGLGAWAVPTYMSRKAASEAAARTKLLMAAGLTGVSAAGVAAGVAGKSAYDSKSKTASALSGGLGQTVALTGLGAAAADLTRQVLRHEPMSVRGLQTIPASAAAGGGIGALMHLFNRAHLDRHARKSKENLLKASVVAAGVGTAGYAANKHLNEKKQEKTAGFMGEVVGGLSHLFGPSMGGAARFGILPGVAGGLVNAGREAARIAGHYAPNAGAEAAAALAYSRQLNNARRTAVANKARGMLENRDVAALAADKASNRIVALKKELKGMDATARNADAYGAVQQPVGGHPGQQVWVPNQKLGITREQQINNQIAELEGRLGKYNKAKQVSFQPVVGTKVGDRVSVPGTGWTASSSTGAQVAKAQRAEFAAGRNEAKKLRDTMAQNRGDIQAAADAQSHLAAGGKAPSWENPGEMFKTHGAQLGKAFAQGAAPAFAVGAGGKYAIDAYKHYRLMQGVKKWAPPVLIGGAAYGLLNRD